MAVDIGIDLGTSFILVYKKNKGIIINEPSIVVFDKNINKIVAVGAEAENMIGRTPSNLIAIRPLKDGVISNFEMTEKLLRYFINKAIDKKSWKRPRVCISIPVQITDLEKRAVEDAAIQAGAREAVLVEAPIAAAVGLGININQPIGNMFVDVGGGTTDIAVISLGSIVASSSLKFAGEEFDKAILSYIRKKYNLLIGLSVAEEVKKEIGSLVKIKNPKYMEIRGRNLNNGLVSTITISSNEIADALSEYAHMIVNEIHYVLEKTNPELAADITYRGIVLSGGSSFLHGLDEVIENSLGIATVVTSNPDTVVVEGVAKYREFMKK